MKFKIKTEKIVGDLVNTYFVKNSHLGDEGTIIFKIVDQDVKNNTIHLVYVGRETSGKVVTGNTRFAASVYYKSFEKGFYKHIDINNVPNILRNYRLS